METTRDEILLLVGDPSLDSVNACGDGARRCG